MTSGQATHVGLRRTDNQDWLGVFPDGSSPDASEAGLYVVADGMGGHLGGSEASRMAVETLQEVYFTHPGEPPERLRAAFDEANGRIFERACAESSLFGMGTTCTALALSGGRAWIAHVGDSRAYRVTAIETRQLTDDHTRVGELVRRQVITEEEATRHPARNILSRAMGVQSRLDVDVFEAAPLLPGDALVLCTDGLATVSGEEIRDVVRSQSPQAACDRLVQLANERGGADNVTVVVLRRAEQAPGPRLTGKQAAGGAVVLLVLVLIAALLLAT